MGAGAANEGTRRPRLLRVGFYGSAGIARIAANGVVLIAVVAMETTGRVSSGPNRQGKWRSPNRKGVAARSGHEGSCTGSAVLTKKKRIEAV